MVKKLRDEERHGRLIGVVGQGSEGQNRACRLGT